MLGLCFYCVDDILGCIGVSMPSYDNCDHVSCLNSWSLRIHYYSVVGIRSIFKMIVCDINGLSVLFKDGSLNKNPYNVMYW